MAGELRKRRRRIRLREKFRRGVRRLGERLHSVQLFQRKPQSPTYWTIHQSQTRAVDPSSYLYTHHHPTRLASDGYPYRRRHQLTTVNGREARGNAFVSRSYESVLLEARAAAASRCYSPDDMSRCSRTSQPLERRRSSCSQREEDVFGVTAEHRTATEPVIHGFPSGRPASARHLYGNNGGQNPFLEGQQRIATVRASPASPAYGSSSRQVTPGHLFPRPTSRFSPANLMRGYVAIFRS